jgi:hypothetical protein
MAIAPLLPFVASLHIERMSLASLENIVASLRALHIIFNFEENDHQFKKY